MINLEGIEKIGITFEIRNGRELEEIYTLNYRLASVMHGLKMYDIKTDLEIFEETYHNKIKETRNFILEQDLEHLVQSSMDDKFNIYVNYHDEDDESTHCKVIDEYVKKSERRRRGRI